VRRETYKSGSERRRLRCRIAQAPRGCAPAAASKCTLATLRLAHAAQAAAHRQRHAGISAGLSRRALAAASAMKRGLPGRQQPADHYPPTRYPFPGVRLPAVYKFAAPPLLQRTRLTHCGHPAYLKPRTTTMFGTPPSRATTHGGYTSHAPTCCPRPTPIYVRRTAPSPLRYGRDKHSTPGACNVKKLFSQPLPRDPHLLNDTLLRPSLSFLQACLRPSSGAVRAMS